VNSRKMGPLSHDETHEQARRKRRVQRRIAALAANLSPILIVVLVLAAWQLLVPWAQIPQLILPTPFQILATMYQQYPLLISDMWVTIFEVLYGFVLAAVVGVPLALAIFYSPIVGKSIYPILVALQTVPKVALAPILVLWFGFGLMPKVAISFLIAVFPIVISTVVGLASLDQEMVYLVRSMGANELQTFLKVRLPAALPSIFGGFKVAIGLAVVGAVIGEYIAAERGLGYRQLAANLQFDSALNFASLICIALCGILTFGMVQLLEYAFVRRRPGNA
jgi:NitT/TauT family transport system permease protein